MTWPCAIAAARSRAIVPKVVMHEFASFGPIPKQVSK